MGSEAQTSQLGNFQRAGMAPLPRQNSIYSLTLDQFQNTMVEPGKTFGSMNMDDFVKNIWTVEENQAMAAALGGAHDAPSGGLIRQPTLPRTLSQKTVDEVWKNIHKGSGGYVVEGGKPDANKQPRQLTLGEMTLEDFLLKAGVFREELEPTNQAFTPYVGGVAIQSRGGVVTDLPQSPTDVLPNENLGETMQLQAYKTGGPTPGEWLNHSYQNPTIAAMSKQQHCLPHHLDSSSFLSTSKRLGNGTSPASGIGGPNVGGGIGLVGGVLGTPLAPGLAEGLVPGNYGLGVGSPLSDEIVPSTEYGFSPDGTYGINRIYRGRKRGAEGQVERVVERRQRRMIKNRESAARSRARKQAYTVELEAEVTQLKEENMRLRKQQEEDAERRKKQMLEVMAPFVQGMRSKACILRRAHSAQW